ncbi:hypothetical protein ABZP36_028500 [Zizania latifolia]
MASSSSSSSSQFNDPAARRPLPHQQRKPPLLMLLPLIYAPVLPLIRIGLRHNPVWRDRLFYGVLAGAFAHGTYLICIASERRMYKSVGGTKPGSTRLAYSMYSYRYCCSPGIFVGHYFKDLVGDRIL